MLPWSNCSWRHPAASGRGFVVNGLQKEVRENALKQHPGCYEALPAAAKAKIQANRAWASKL